MPQWPRKGVLGCLQRRKNELRIHEKDDLYSSISIMGIAWRNSGKIKLGFEILRGFSARKRDKLREHHLSLLKFERTRVFTTSIPYLLCFKQFFLPVMLLC